jgi:hypothetical protein
MTSTQVTSLDSAYAFANDTLNVTSAKLAADSVTTAKIVANNVTLTKLATVPADSILANSGNTTGNVSTITCTAAGRAILDDVDASAQRTTLGLGTLATQNANATAITGGTIAGADITLTGKTLTGGTISSANITLTGKTLTGGTLDGVTLTNVTGGATPSAHASAHITGGSDAIQSATTSQNGLMTSTQVTSLAAAESFANGTLNVTSGKLAADSVTTTKIAANNVTLTKLATIPADSILANSGNATGNVSTITCTAAGRALLDDANATAQRTTLGLGTLATQNSSNVTITGGTLDGVVLTNAIGAGGNVSTATGILPVVNGGTGFDSYAVGDIVYADTTTTVAKLAATTTGNALISGGNATAPSYGKIGLTTHVSGTLPVANGGTNITSYAVGDIVYANTTTSLTKLSATTAGNALISNGSATAPTYGKIGLTTHVSGTLPVANGGTSITSYAVGDIVYANTTTSLAKLAATTTGNALISGGTDTAPSYGKIGLTTHVSGILPIANGGTGSTTIPAANVTTATGILPVANGGTGYGSDGIGTLTFDTSPSLAVLSEGQLRWNATDKTLDLQMAGGVTQQIGQELLMRVHCATEFFEGLVYAITGSNAGLPSVSLVTAASANCKKILGVATQNATTDDEAYLTLNGIVGDLDLSGFTAGDELFLGEAGELTTIAPEYPNHKVRVGYVINPVDTIGSLYASIKYFDNDVSTATGILPVVNGGTGFDSYAVGDIVYADTTTTVAKLAATTTGNALISGGNATAPSYGKIGLTTHVSGTLPVANGGTGATQSAYGEYYISSTPVATTIVSIGAFVKVAGTTTTGNLSNFTNATNNRLTYTGTTTRKFLITAALSFHGTGTNDYKFAFYKNTSTILTASIISTTGTGAGNLAHVSCQCIVELATTDFIELFVANADATNNPTVDFMNVTAVALI